jgi:multidrug efflux pump subunit AcrA (membrane-fusion protein)
LKEKAMQIKRYGRAGAALLVLWTAGCRQDRPAPEPKPESGAASSVTLTPAAEAAAGIRTVKAGFRRLEAVVHAKGVIAFNPRRTAEVTAKAGGIVETVSAFEGDRVTAGQELAALYCPEFLAGQAECLQIRDRLAAAVSAGDSLQARVLTKLLRSAEDRLLFLGASRQDLLELTAGGRTAALLSLRAPFSGSVVRAAAVAGGPVEPSTVLFSLADPAALWAVVHIQEKDLEDVRPGCAVEVRVDAYPGVVFAGRLTVMGDALDEATRTVKGRVELKDGTGRLKPGMYAEAALAGRRNRPSLCVPETAVRIADGSAVVFAARRGGRYTALPVTIGRTLSGYTEILSGLNAGDTVATEGSFTLKSELLKASLEGE